MEDFTTKTAREMNVSIWEAVRIISEKARSCGVSYSEYAEGKRESDLRRIARETNANAATHEAIDIVERVARNLEHMRALIP